VETIKDTFCKNFKKFVEASSLSQKSIAEKVGVSEQTFYRWARGENTPGHENLEELGNVLGVKPSDFYMTEKQEPLPLPVSKTLQKLMAIPDDVYEAAQGVPHGHEIWGIVKDYLENAKEETRLANLLNKG
jgi:transcriptional regulator with XRE-family HTH domain